MGLFGKKIPDAEWRRAVLPISEVISRTCDAFDSAGRAVQSDPITGWTSVEETLSSLAAYEEAVKTAKKTFKGAGKPECRNMLIETAKTALDEFFGTAGLAFHWGKYHYGDASGGPGQRAIHETGFAQKAAVKRLTNNGLKFAESALRAATAGRAALESLSGEAYDTQRPALMDLFLEGAQPGISNELQSLKSLPLSQLSVLGSWCYSRAAILGMVASSSPSPSPFIATIWNPAKIDSFWQRANEEIERLDSSTVGGGLAGLRNQTGYPELYGEDAMRAATSGDFKGIEKLAATKVPLSEARVRWAMDTALGLGVGLLRPDFVRERLEADANPDRKSWAEAHQAGLDIPPEPDAVAAVDQIEELMEGCRPFFQEYYPEAFEALARAID